MEDRGPEPTVIPLFSLLSRPDGSKAAMTKLKTSDTPTRAEASARLHELIDAINFAMLTTVTPGGVLRSRPMATQQFDAKTGSIWFLTSSDSPKVDEIADEQQVGLSYAEPSNQRYVSVSGRARVIRDKAKAAELWTPAAKIWFPDGVDDPRLVLLCIEVEAAEYWDSPSSKMVKLFGLAKLAVTGTPPDNLGENVKVDTPLVRPAR